MVEFNNTLSDKCPVCNKYSLTYFEDQNADWNEYDCQICGKFLITRTLKKSLDQKLSSEKHRVCLSNWIYSNPDERVQLDALSINIINNLQLPPPYQRAQNAFIYLAKVVDNLGDVIPMDMAKLIMKTYSTGTTPVYLSNILLSKMHDKLLPYIAQLFAVTFSYNDLELITLVKDFLIDNYQYLIESMGSFKGNGDYDGWKITPKGWNFLESHSKGINSKTAFIAMKFNPNVMKLFNSITDEIEKETGYKLRIISDKNHSNIIDDEIKVEIKKSSFIISDLTYNSRGAYYEAGYAHGLGKPVIFTIGNNYLNSAKKNKKDRIHFDASHYQYYTWINNEKGIKAFAKKLINRILADDRIGKASASFNKNI